MARIILFWCFENINFLGKIMEFKVQFWHPSDLRLWRTGCVICIKIGWWNSNVHCSWTCLWRKISKILILLPLRTIYFRTFQCETPCSYIDYFSPAFFWKINFRRTCWWWKWYWQWRGTGLAHCHWIRWWGIYCTSLFAPLKKIKFQTKQVNFFTFEFRFNSNQSWNA